MRNATHSLFTGLMLTCACALYLLCSGCFASGTAPSSQPDDATDPVTGLDVVPIAGEPDGVCGDIGTNVCYVTCPLKDTSGNVQGGAIEIVDLTTATLTKSISTVTESPYPPRSPALNPVTKKLYVALGDSIGVCDVSMNTLKTKIKLPQQYETASALCVDSTANRVYAACSTVGASPTVAILDGASDTLIKEVKVAQAGQFIRVNPVTHRIFVGAQDYTASDSTPCQVYELAGDTGEVISNNAYAGIINGIALCGTTTQLAISVSPTYSQPGDLRVITPDKHAGRDATKGIKLPAGYTVIGLPFTTTTNGISANLYVDAKDASAQKHLLVFNVSDFSLIKDYKINTPGASGAGSPASIALGWVGWNKEVRAGVTTASDGRLIGLPQSSLGSTANVNYVDDVKFVTQ